MFDQKGNYKQYYANALEWIMENIQKDLNLLQSNFNSTIYNDCEYYISLINDPVKRNKYEEELKKFAE